MAENEYPEGWFDEFWSAVDMDDDTDGVSAVRLIGELFAAEAMWRDGDYLVGRSGAKVWLSSEDQYLVRRIEGAVDHAREATGNDGS